MPTRTLLAQDEIDTGDQRYLMGYVSGWMYAGTGVIGLLGLLLPALRYHLDWQLGLGLASFLYGILIVRGVMHWERRPMSTHIAAMALALPIVALAIWATGGAMSYMRPVLLLAPIHWGFFLERRRVLAGLCLGLIVALWLPLVYEPRADHPAELGVMAGGSLTVLVIGASLSLVRARLGIAEAELRRLAVVDPLTGLLNRRGFDASLRRLVASADSSAMPFLVLMDLDHLKRINDVHGHAAGDAALRFFAQRLTADARGSDLLGRFGGDEFAVVGLTRDPGTVDRIASRLELAVAAELPGVVGARVGATTGWATTGELSRDHGSLTAELFGRADERLLANKRARTSSDSLTARPA